jgi:hypothetical protein
VSIPRTAAQAPALTTPWGEPDLQGIWTDESDQHDTATLCPKKIPNAGRDLALLHEHLAKDDLIAWGWNPGLGRVPVPGTQARLGELIQAWIDTGAQCP